MKTTTSFVLVAFLFLLGCSKLDDELNANLTENQFPDAVTKVQDVNGSVLDANRIASPITPWGVGATVIWDNTSVLQTAVWAPPGFGTSFPNYSFGQFPTYDFSPYYLNGETEYNPANYDLMTHFGYISPEAVTGAFVEFTFPQIEYILPHITNSNQQRIYTINNINNQTVISCTTNLIKGMNPMFCFLVKVDCGKGKSGYATIWSDMKVNGVSVKGTIKNKVFACN